VTRREVTHRATCAEPDCAESAFWTYDNQADRRDHLRRLAESPWRCTRHTQPGEVLSIDNAERSHVLTATRLPHLPDHLFWMTDGAKSGSGFVFGPGFKAFAKDFPEGTRLVITVRVEAAP
jgi:hypothetical protein